MLHRGIALRVRKIFAQSDNVSGTGQPPTVVSGTDAVVESKPVIYVVTKRVAITTDDGIISLDAGQRVKLVKDNGATLLVSDGGNNLEIDKSNLVEASVAASAAAAQGPAGVKGAGGKHDPDDFDTNYPYGEALEACVSADFDGAAQRCEEAYRVNPSVPGIIHLRNLIYVMRLREQQLKQAKSMAASGQYVDGKQAVTVAQQQYDAAFNTIQQFARPERLRVLALIQNLRVKAHDNIVQEDKQEDADDVASVNKSLKRNLTLIAIGGAIAVVGFLIWVINRQIT